MDRHDIVHLMDTLLMKEKPELHVGEARKKAYDWYFFVTKTEPKGERCSYCGRDEFEIDKDGYGPCGCK